MPESEIFWAKGGGGDASAVDCAGEMAGAKREQQEARKNKKYRIESCMERV